MGKRLKDYIEYIEKRIAEPITEDDRIRAKEDLLTQIAFFQHERHIHLIVTALFAILTMLALMAILLTDMLILWVLLVLFVVLLIPYVAHYYKLENGVQRLYQSYDKLVKLEESK